jgi:hypothetical protein
MENLGLICISSGGNFAYEKYDPFTHCFVFLAFLAAAASALICHLQQYEVLGGLFPTTFKIFGAEIYLICIKLPKICKLGKIQTQKRLEFFHEINSSFIGIAPIVLCAKKIGKGWTLNSSQPEHGKCLCAQ